MKSRSGIGVRGQGRLPREVMFGFLGICSRGRHLELSQMGGARADPLTPRQSGGEASR